MHVVLAGASGFLGTHLRHRLTAGGHEIVTLVRRRATAAHERTWAPERGELDPQALAGADAVINLAGTTVGPRRWTRAYRTRILSSRVDATATLAAALAELPDGQRPAVLLNGSGASYYGDTGDTAVDERASGGAGFMAEVCQAWEAATEPAAAAGMRVVRLRTAPALHRDNHMVKPMVIVFRLFVGGRFGTGRQWYSWIALDDWLAAVEFLLTRNDISGPVNLVGPSPVRNAEFASAFGRVLHRPALIPLPSPLFRLVLGEAAREALRSYRVLPGVLNRAGFSFRYPDLDSALRAALQR